MSSYSTNSSSFIIGQPALKSPHHHASPPPRLPLHQAQDQMELAGPASPPRLPKAHKAASLTLSPGKMAAAVTGAGCRKKTVVHVLGGPTPSAETARAKRPICEHPSPNKRVKTTVAEVVYHATQSTHAPPPPRTAPPPLVVGVPLAGSSKTAQSKATKSMNAIDAQVKATTATGMGLHGPAPPTAKDSPPAVASTCKFSLRSSSAAAVSAAAPSVAAGPTLQAPVEVTATTTASLAGLAQRLDTAHHLPGMAELLAFVVHAQVQSQDHAALFAATMAALQTQHRLRKDLCDFEQVFDCTAPVYGKKASAIFQELGPADGKFAVPTESYHEHLFMRLWMHFVVTRLQLVRDLVEGHADEVALVDAQLKQWWKRAYEYM